MLQKLSVRLRRSMTWLQVIVLAGMGLAPVLVAGTAHAAPALVNRQLQTTTGRPSQSVDLTWVFDTTAAVANVDYIEIEFCDAPLGTCAITKTPTLSNTPTATLTNFTTNTVAATIRQGGDSGGANNQYQIDKTNVDSGTSLTGATISFGATDITNNATPNASYYTRMRLYSDTGTTLVWEGVFAQSTSQTLTVNARVQERLDFCVGSTTVNDATTSVGAACANVTGTDVNIGNIEGGFSNVSPVTAVNGGDGENGVAMLRTNAFNGAVVDYKSVQDTASGALKVPGAVCAPPSVTDQCFNSAGTTTAQLAAGTERFGMTVAGVNCGSTTAYTCTFAAGTYNLIRDDNYDGTANASQNNTTYVSDTDQVGGTTSGFYTWDDTGTADRIASSAGSTVKVVDDEALILKFAATASATTPTGSYTVQTDLYATATF